jgi:hypothetical protein
MKLTESLSNFRAIDPPVRDAYAGIKVRASIYRQTCRLLILFSQRNNHRANTALTAQIPQTCNQLDEASFGLTELMNTLPDVQQQISHIRGVYDSGRTKVSRFGACPVELTTLYTGTASSG